MQFPLARAAVVRACLLTESIQETKPEITEDICPSCIQVWLLYNKKILRLKKSDLLILWKKQDDPRARNPSLNFLQQVTAEGPVCGQADQETSD